LERNRGYSASKTANNVGRLNMKLATILTAFTVASAVSFAQAQSTPPTPRPAAVAAPQLSSAPVHKNYRTQTPEEQRMSQQTSPMDLTQVGQSRNPR
jgi:hypothetical protein